MRISITYGTVTHYTLLTTTIQAIYTQLTIGDRYILSWLLYYYIFFSPIVFGCLLFNCTLLEALKSNILFLGVVHNTQHQTLYSRFVPHIILNISTYTHTYMISGNVFIYDLCVLNVIYAFPILLTYMTNYTDSH
jgi:hypothetical protein